ncbi:DHA2 family efflux MFS transporter permease subunit [Planotetraspora kaengkrachanensis]|uniref:MFS transporter n=1 Tax=Planotetraspora kaengkrachanensis TaxID=575193 RepID=A0A8J3LSS8_9ACTN|nr:DHA2 family efflux MFS transporter permease subunit [Planotetraspora kaengkrachanensis]GIG78102.1 MFS transporter [Planotetraspora kaengkrachanensis]
MSRRRRILVLLICCMSLLIVALDNTIVNVALPSLGHELRAPVSGLQWTIDAYTLTLASLLMLSGSTADRIGRRRTFQTGLVAFTAGSLLCSLAPSLTWLVVFRIVQAVGGSMLNPVAMSIITNTFTDRRERAQAIGVWGGVVGISMALGPVIGGLLTDTVGWRAIFWINVPIGVLAFLLTWKFVPESKAKKARRIDPVGQALVIVLLASLTYGIIEGPGTGWTSPLILACFSVTVLTLAFLIVYEYRREEPLIDVRFFRSAPFSGAAAIAVCGFAGLGSFLFLNTLYLQSNRGFTALEAGLCTLPIALMAMVFGPLSGRLVGIRGPRPSLLIAGVCITVTGVLLAQVALHTSLVLLLAVFAVFGLGFGMLNPPITNTAVSGMPLEQAGVAAAVASTSRQIGQSLGVAIVGSVVATAGHGAEFMPAAHIGWWIIAGYGALILGFALLTTGRWAQGTAARTAERLKTMETVTVP